MHQLEVPQPKYWGQFAASGPEICWEEESKAKLIDDENRDMPTEHL